MKINCSDFFKEKFKSLKEKGGLGSYILKTQNCQENPRTTSEDNDLIMEIAMQGCRILCGGQRT